MRRLLPRRQRRMVGARCFLDVFGPIAFTDGKPLDVPPHPHIGLQTVTWLLKGEAPNILMWWNFVARTMAEIEAAREEWEHGRRFGAVAAYDGERLPAPRFTARPVPANPVS